MKDLIVDPAKETVACPATPKRPSLRCNTSIKALDEQVEDDTA